MQNNKIYLVRFTPNTEAENMMLTGVTEKIKRSQKRQVKITYANWVFDMLIL